MGKETMVARRDRKATLVNHKIESLFIPKTSDTSKLILSLWKEHQDFRNKYQNDLADSTFPADEPEPEFTTNPFANRTYVLLEKINRITPQVEPSSLVVCSI